MLCDVEWRCVCFVLFCVGLRCFALVCVCVLLLVCSSRGLVSVGCVVVCVVSFRLVLVCCVGWLCGVL